MRRPIHDRYLAAWLAPAAIAALVATAAADPAPPDPAPVPPDSVALTVPEVQVSALRGHEPVREIPAAAFVIPRARFSTSSAGRMATTLSTLPGFFGYRQTGSGEPSVVDPRGFTANGESSYLKLLVNGQDVRDVENGAVDWDWLLTDDVSRVEVVQGSGAWLYGDGSEGGVVNVVVPEASDGFHSDCAARVGSFGYGTASLAVRGGLQTWRNLGRASLRRADGWRDRSAEEVYGAGIESTWPRSGGSRIALDASYLDARNEDPGALTPDELRADRTQAETQTDYRHSRRVNLGLHLVRAPRANEAWQLSPYYRHEDVDQVRTLFFTPESHPTTAETGGAELRYDRALTVAGRALALNAGTVGEWTRLDSRYENYGTGALETQGIGHRVSFSGYAAGRLDLDARTLARLGVRGDVIREGPLERLNDSEVPARTLSAVSPFVSLSRTVGAEGTIYGSFSTGFRAPTLNQLFDQRPFYDPIMNVTIFISNPNLEPQRTTNFELGGRLDRQGSTAQLALYSTRVSNEIDFDLGTFSYANIGKSWHRGVELAITQAIAGRFTVIANGAFTPTTIVDGDHDGNQINAVPRGTAYGALAFAAPRGFGIEGGVRYTGRQYLDEANEHALADFATLEVAGSAHVTRIRATLRVANLLDREYVDSGFIGALGEERLLPAAGRSFSLALALD